jgi:hypothetical protein
MKTYILIAGRKCDDVRDITKNHDEQHIRVQDRDDSGWICSISTIISLQSVGKLLIFQETEELVL